MLTKLDYEPKRPGERPPWVNALIDATVIIGRVLLMFFLTYLVLGWLMIHKEAGW